MASPCLSHLHMRREALKACAAAVTNKGGGASVGGRSADAVAAGCRLLLAMVQSPLSTRTCLKEEQRSEATRGSWESSTMAAADGETRPPGGPSPQILLWRP